MSNSMTDELTSNSPRSAHIVIHPTVLLNLNDQLINQQQNSLTTPSTTITNSFSPPSCGLLFGHQSTVSDTITHTITDIEYGAMINPQDLQESLSNLSIAHHLDEDIYSSIYGHSPSGYYISLSSPQNLPQNHHQITGSISSPQTHETSSLLYALYHILTPHIATIAALDTAYTTLLSNTVNPFTLLYIPSLASQYPPITPQTFSSHVTPNCLTMGLIFVTDLTSFWTKLEATFSSSNSPDPSLVHLSSTDCAALLAHIHPTRQAMHDSETILNNFQLVALTTRESLDLNSAESDILIENPVYPAQQEITDNSTNNNINPPTVRALEQLLEKLTIFQQILTTAQLHTSPLNVNHDILLKIKHILLLFNISPLRILSHRPFPLTLSRTDIFTESSVSQDPQFQQHFDQLDILSHELILQLLSHEASL